MIYLPLENINDFSCYYFINSDTIRAYKEKPTIINQSYDFTDFYINSHYLSQEGREIFTDESSFPICLQNEKITNVVSYRNDFADIMIIVFILVFLFGFIICKFIKQLFKGKK